MSNPVFYIAEAPSFGANEILLVLLVLLAVFAVFISLLVAGIKGFHRLGRGERRSTLARAAPVIGVLDVLFLLSTRREAFLFAIAPLIIHAVAYGLGYSERNGPPYPTRRRGS